MCVNKGIGYYDNTLTSSFGNNVYLQTYIFNENQ